jgi:protein required for attachment to host cells
MGRIWVLVANQAEAAIYSMDRLRGSLTPVETLLHAAGRARVQDLISDAPGRAQDRVGPARHSMEPDVGFKAEETRRFARQIVDNLKVGLEQHNFERLILVAAPAFLGVIRKELSAQLAEAVIEEIPKDMVGRDVKEIQEHMS